MLQRMKIDHEPELRRRRLRLASPGLVGGMNVG